MTERNPGLGEILEVTGILKEVDRGVIRSFFEVLADKSGKEAAPRIRVELNRWDTAITMFIWTDGDGLNRNVAVYLADKAEGDKQRPVPVMRPTPLLVKDMELVVEINAWKDYEKPDGTGVRSFRSDLIARLDPFVKTPKLKKALRSAYETLSSLNEEDLKQRSTLVAYVK